MMKPLNTYQSAMKVIEKDTGSSDLGGVAVSVNIMKLQSIVHTG